MTKKKNTAAPPVAPRPRLTLVYAYRSGERGRTFIFYRLLESGERSPESVGFELDRKIGRDLNPGHVYTVEWDPKNGTDRLSIFPGTISWLRPWSVDADRRDWEARDRTLNATLAARKLEADSAREHNDLDRLLQQLTSTYTSLPYSQQPAFLALVISSMTRGRVP
jgi:hypothetical protein